MLSNPGRKTLAPLLALTLAATATTQTPWTPDHTWPFLPTNNAPKNELDLRYLNEKTAGESGFVKIDPEGQFQLGSGKPARFWCVLTNVGEEKPFNPKPRGRQTEPDLPTHARFLAAHGVNMVRLFSGIQPNPDQPVNQIKTNVRDWMWRAVAAMKNEGIYSTLCPYWAIPVKIGKSWGIPGADQENAAGLLFFEPKLQQAYWGWLKDLYTTKNPYTGIPLGQDPAVAVIQIQNEDSLLFWTVNNLKGQVKRDLETQFATWIAKKYKGQIPWADQHLPEDNPAQGIYDFYNVWEMTQNRTGHQQLRLADQTQFWTETMYNFNKATETYLRSLGVKPLINAGNWRTADSAHLLAAERYSYTANEVDAINRYFTGVHLGPNNGWNIQVGDKFTSESALRISPTGGGPGELPSNLIQTARRPMLITESAWVMPNGYASEAPLLISAYQSLTGLGGYFWFATNDDEWTQPQSGNGYNPGQQKWLFGNPDMLGTFPGAALMYRAGYVKRGEPASETSLPLNAIWDRKTPEVAEESGFDPNRDSARSTKITKSNQASATLNDSDPLAFLVGPVLESFGKPDESLLFPFPKISGRVESDTREISLDYRHGSCTVNTPCAQGVTAFFNSTPQFSLKDVDFESANEYGAALAISLDGLPLATSHRVLIQYATRSRPTDWQEKPITFDADDHHKSVPGFEVLNTGHAPWLVQEANLKITLRNPSLTKATVLDINGHPTESLPLHHQPSSISFQFPPRSLYVILEKS